MAPAVARATSARASLKPKRFQTWHLFKILAKSCLWRGHVRQNNFYSLVTENLISVFLQTGSNQFFTDQSMKYFSFYTVTGLGYRLGLPGKIQMKSHFYIVSNIKRIY